MIDTDLNRNLDQLRNFAIVFLILAVGGPILLVGIISYESSHPNPVTVTEPGKYFTAFSGFPWPSNAKVISVGDSHGGFPGDGEFHVVFETDPATIDSLLHMSKFQRGPIPREFGGRGFGDVGEVHTSSTNGGPWEYGGDPQMISLLTSKEIWYKAEDTCCSGMRWHNGTVLILDPRHNRVWFAKWDY